MNVKILIAIGPIAAMAAMSLVSSAAYGQAPPPSPSLVPIPTRTYIGFNPLGLPADIGTAELETAVAPGMTLGGVASYIDADDRRFTTFDFNARYYPAGIVLRGASVGASAGYTRFSNVVNGTRQELSAPTLGILVDYNWMYGRDQHFLIGSGIGAKRVLASGTDRDRANVDRAVFTVRLIVGFAF